MTQISKHLPRTPRQAARRRGPVDSLLDPDLFKALSDPTRVSLLACMMKCGRGCTVSEVAECCSVDFSVVSRHLKALQRAEVLEAVKSGRTVTYTVRFTNLAQALRQLADAIEACCPATEHPADGGCCESC